LLTLINDGTIDANYGGGILTLYTGQTITNAGLLEATNGGTLLIKDGVSGGAATIAGGSLVFNASSNVNVTFNNGTGTPTYGELVLADAPAFSGQIFGFTGTAPGLTTSDAIDLTDINFANLKETYTENTAGTGGTLTVSDGTNTATLYFSGAYAPASFNFATDGQGGTLVTDPPPAGTTTSTDSSLTTTSTDSSSTTWSTDSSSTTTSTDNSSNLVPDVDQTGKHPTLDPLLQALQNGADQALPHLADLPAQSALPQQAWDNTISQALLGAISKPSAGEALDLEDVAFGASKTLGYSPNASGMGDAGVNDGMHTASIALFSQYAAAGFQLGNQNNGALVTHPSSLASENDVLITNPNHKP
jgi:hypothetical protein